MFKKFNVEKTKALQRIGQQKRSEFSADFTALYTHIKELGEELKALDSSCQKMLAASAKLTASGAQTAESVRAVAQRLPAQQAILRALLVDVWDAMRQNDLALDDLSNKLTINFHQPVARFVEDDVNGARHEKEAFRQTLVQTDAAESQVKSNETSLQTGHGALLAAQIEYFTSLRKYRARFLQASNRMVDIVMRKDKELLDHAVRMTQESYIFFANSYRTLHLLCEKVDANYVAQLQADRQRFLSNKARLADARVQRDKQEDDNKYNDLMKMIANPNLQVLNAICLSAGADQEATLDSTIKILDVLGNTMPIIRIGITKEVESCTAAATLFRSNNTATKLITAFTRMVGRPYLVATLAELVAETRAMGSVEVDPSKITDGANAEENMAKLIQLTQRYLDTIISSVPLMPPPFREICAHLRAEAVKKFPDAKHSVIGGFIFLRFFCPAMISPDSNGLADAAVPRNELRTLILVSKALQNLSNGVKFGQKEQFMAPMNEFIESNLGGVQLFFDDIAQPPPKELTDAYEPLITMDEAQSHYLPSLHDLIVKNLASIASTLTKYKETEAIPNLAHVMGTLSYKLERNGYKCPEIVIVDDPTMKKK